MNATGTSYELLAHFDHQPERCQARSVSTRGIGWVLRWAAALAVLFFAGCELAQFACCLAAEHTLARAARAGAMEATLPRATHDSIVRSVERRLTSYRLLPGTLRIRVQQNGRPIGRALHAREGDQLSVAIAVPSDAVTPQWLRRAPFWSDGSKIEVRAERQVPGRKLTASTKNAE